MDSGLACRVNVTEGKKATRLGTVVPRLGCANLQGPHDTAHRERAENTKALTVLVVRNLVIYAFLFLWNGLKRRNVSPGVNFMQFMKEGGKGERKEGMSEIGG